MFYCTYALANFEAFYGRKDFDPYDRTAGQYICNLTIFECIM